MSIQPDTQNSATSRPNLRHYHRIAVKLEGTITTDQGDATNCRITNLSRDGVMIPCSAETLDRTMPNHESVAPHLAVPVWFEFQLPDTNSEGLGPTIQCRCDIVYVRRVSRDCFNMGMSFASFEGDGQQQLDDYINQQLQRGA